MEKKFYPDNFEQLLKESTDNFRMYPSKRVWHSIYNDLHPSRKWPSLAIWMLLISSIVYIGLSNKNHSSNNKNQASLTAGNPIPDNNTTGMIASVATQPGTTNMIAAAKNSNATVKVDPVYAHAVTQRNLSNTNSRIDIKTTGLFNEANNKETQQQVGNLTSLIKQTPDLKNADNIDPTGKTLAGSPVSTNLYTGPEKETVIITDIKDLLDNKKEPAVTDPVAKKADAETKKDLSITNKNNTTEKEWIEDFAFHNKPLTNKWKKRRTYEFYFTPSIGYRIFSKNTDFNTVSSSLVATSGNTQDYKKAFSHVAAVNMEIGGNILYSVSRNWNLKAGIQLNYTNYNINAYELKHPTMTTLTLNDLNNGLPILDPRPTTLANISGVASKKLNNNTYQLSLPLGADIKIAGKNNIKWYAGATIQPTFIIGGNAYLISSDLKNYVTDKSLMRKWNLNAGLETYISYKTQGGLIINAGPQFRYQFLSTYSNKYTYNERLYNLGLKIGIITRF